MVGKAPRRQRSSSSEAVAAPYARGGGGSGSGERPSRRAAAGRTAEPLLAASAYMSSLYLDDPENPEVVERLIALVKWKGRTRAFFRSSGTSDNPKEKTFASMFIPMFGVFPMDPKKAERVGRFVPGKDFTDFVRIVREDKLLPHLNAEGRKEDQTVCSIWLKAYVDKPNEGLTPEVERWAVRLMGRPLREDEKNLLGRFAEPEDVVISTLLPGFWNEAPEFAELLRAIRSSADGNVKLRVADAAQRPPDVLQTPIDVDRWLKLHGLDVEAISRTRKHSLKVDRPGWVASDRRVMDEYKEKCQGWYDGAAASSSSSSASTFAGWSSDEERVD